MTSGATRRDCDAACELRLPPEHSFESHSVGTAVVSCEPAGEDSGLATDQELVGECP